MTLFWILIAAVCLLSGGALVRYALVLRDLRRREREAAAELLLSALKLEVLRGGRDAAS